MFPLLFNVYMVAVMKEMKTLMGRMWLRFSEEGGEWRLSYFLYVDDLYYGLNRKRI